MADATEPRWSWETALAERPTADHVREEPAARSIPALPPLPLLSPQRAHSLHPCLIRSWRSFESHPYVLQHTLLVPCCVYRECTLGPMAHDHTDLSSHQTPTVAMLRSLAASLI